MYVKGGAGLGIIGRSGCLQGWGRTCIPFIEMEKINSSCSIVPYKAMNGLLFFFPSISRKAPVPSTSF